LPVLYRTVDYHTAGEPFRIVTAGVQAPPGVTVADRREAAIAHADDGAADRARRILCSEPRGHADMYGCFLTPPDPVLVGVEPAAVGVLFWHKDGFSTACGHGTIALATWLVDEGYVQAPSDGRVAFAIDVPSGRVGVEVRCVDGRVADVIFTNVPAWISVDPIVVPTSVGDLEVAVAFGGAFYASVRAADVRRPVLPDALPWFIGLSREIRQFFTEDPKGVLAVTHPDDERLSGLYGVTWFEDVPAVEPEVTHQRNVTVFADGEVDRSPCGSGTSARVVLLRQHGLLPDTYRLRHESVIGTEFDAWATHDHPDGGVVTRVRGSAYRTGEHAFVLDPHDGVGPGFVLR
jgi:proline racemase